ncbi:MAG: hypothetical protein ACRERD_22690 [Candidatus Binatia bacterium]
MELLKFLGSELRLARKEISEVTATSLQEIRDEAVDQRKNLKQLTLNTSWEDVTVSQDPFEPKTHDYLMLVYHGEEVYLSGTPTAVTKDWMTLDYSRGNTWTINSNARMRPLFDGNHRPHEKSKVLRRIRLLK